MFLWKCSVFDSKNSNFEFIKQQEASWLLSSWGIKTPLSKILLVVPPFFKVFKQLIQGIKWIK